MGLPTFLAVLAYVVTSFLVFKRHMKVSLFFSIGTVAIYIIFTFLPVAPSYAFGVLAPLMSFSLIPYHREVVSVSLATVPALVGSLVLARDLPFVVVYLVVVGIVTYLYSKALNGKGVKVIGIPALKVARPFISSFTDGKVGLVEEFLKSVGTNMDLQVVLFRFEGSSTHYWVIPKIHFGLFGSVGSSRFVYQVEEVLPNATVFHGPGSHEIDMVSSSEAEAVAKRIEREVNAGWSKLKFLGLTRETSGNFSAWSMNFNEAKLSFLTRPGLGIDDLPLSLWTTMISRNSFLVDSHNQSLKEEIEEGELGDLEALLIRATGSESRLFLGYGEGLVEGKSRGLCSEKVKAFALSDGTKRLVLVYLYGNNAEDTLNSKLREENADLAEDVLLVTPDDHSCTGVSVESLYYPVSYSPELSRAVRSAILNALNHMEQVQASMKVFTINSVRVIGKVISSLTKALEEVGAFTTKTIWIPIFSPLAIMVLVLLIQGGIELGIHVV
ncbi:hypothetical protein GCM10007116_13510 [Sulfodiicoccus acidiphilus]|uniref:DUF2070 domain-containing protein n=1 Tax=Sulfodiicoccus acidiphilus TaxID=1670455 RepID=A0A830H2D9_9CREN|nr:hypothetical protein GCM10007116_13510 [Sulfodiicoccus acidiphilus]